MVVTYDITIPPDEELTVPEVDLSYPVLHAAAFYLGKYCENHNNVSYFCIYSLIIANILEFLLSQLY